MPRTGVKGGEKLRAALILGRRGGGVKGVDVGFYKDARYPLFKTGRNGRKRSRGMDRPSALANTNEQGVPVTNVAAWNEFGTATIPERPFFRQANESVKPKLKRLLKLRTDPKRMIMDERSAGEFGLVCQAEVQKSIVRLREPPNAPSTRRIKGSSNPLIDTGFMRQSVTFRVIN